MESLSVSLPYFLLLMLANIGTSWAMNDADVFDASDVTWAHAVNSRAALDKELAGSVDFLEADISVGHVASDPNKDFNPPLPIMAHPPDTTSDISLESWLDTVISRKAGKGIKLDFKSLDVVEPSLLILEQRIANLSFPLWLNADILPGPVDPTTTPVQADRFLSLVQQYFPLATLSIGWTTSLFPATPLHSWEYKWKHVRQMADAIRCRGYENPYPKITFPVRAVFATRSIKQLQWLLAVVPGSSLTVWSARFDPIEVDNLLKIRAALPKNKVYYDIPEPVNGVFQKLKGSATTSSSEYPVASDERWMTVTRGQGDPCVSFTYINNDMLVFGKSLQTAVLMKNVLLVDTHHDLKVRGKVRFFYGDTNSPELLKDSQELTIVLADVRLFSKNSSSASSDNHDLSTSDSDVIWSALNASFLHKFEHKLMDDKTTCRFFNLDTTSERPFQAWTVPCESFHEGNLLEEAVRKGSPEVPKRKRLVLPEGPFMLGFFSSGEEHVVVYDLVVNGKNDGITSAASTNSAMLYSLVFCVLSAVMALIFL